MDHQKNRRVCSFQYFFFVQGLACLRFQNDTYALHVLMRSFKITVLDLAKNANWHILDL